MSNYKFSDYWAVTLFSFTNELLAAKQTSLELVEGLLDSGLTHNIELDGPMHFRNYPNPASSEIADLKALLTRHNARISLLGGTVDRAISSTRLVDPESVLDSVKTQLALAAEIGAFGLRLMVGSLSLAELNQLGGIAESLDVKILFELHGVMAADSQTALECLQLVKDVNSSHVRLMFDSSLFMRELPTGLVESFKALGVANADEIAQHWKKSSLIEFRNWLMPQVESFSPRFKAFLPTLLSRVGHSSPDDFDEYLPYVESVHLKYWEVDEDVAAAEELIEYLAKNNYAGYLTSEWGGHEWYSLKQISSADATRAHRAQVEQIFSLAY